MSRDPLDPDEIVAAVMARAGKDRVDAGVLHDVAEALLQVGRTDLAADWALRAYQLALKEQDPAAASRALAFMVMRLGRAGRRALSDA